MSEKTVNKIRVGEEEYDIRDSSVGEQVQVLEDELDDVKSAMNNKADTKIVLNTSASKFARKTGRSTDVNDPQDSTTRIMSVPFISVSSLAKKTVTVTPTEGYKWIIYQSDGTNYIGGFASYTWSESAGTVNIADNAVSIILLIAKSDNAEILTSDFDKVEFSLTFDYIIQEEFDALEDEVESLDEKVGEIYEYKDVTFTESGGQIYYVSGNVGTSGDYNHTDYIPVNAGEVYKFTGVLSGVDNNASGVVGYNSSKEYVKGLVGKKYSSRTLYEDVEFTIDTGIAYIRACSAVKGTTKHDIELRQVMTDSIEARLNETREDVEGLSVSDYCGIETAFTAKKNFAESSASTRWKNNLTYLPAFLHISDLHLDAARFVRAARAAKNLGVDGLILSGDFCNSPDDDISFVSTAVDSNSIQLLPCIGNHDARNKTEQFINGKFIDPFDGSFSYPQGVDYPTYYYKDFADKSIRIISVDQYQGQSASGSQDKIHFTQDQITFFCNALLNTPQGYGVIVIMHTPEYTPVANASYPKFFQSALYYSAPTNPHPICEIVDAFISGGTLSKTYNNESGSTPETFTVSADFSTKNTGVEFIAFACGHLHADAISYVPNVTNKQLLLNITCAAAWVNMSAALAPATNYPYFTELSDLGRAELGPNQDAMNLYVIDRPNKSVRVVRVGANMPYNLGEKRDYMIIPYAD